MYYKFFFTNLVLGGNSYFTSLLLDGSVLHTDKRLGRLRHHRRPMHRREQAGAISEREPRGCIEAGVWCVGLIKGPLSLSVLI